MKQISVVIAAAGLSFWSVALHAQTKPARGGSATGNLHQIGQAIMMYANDYKGRLPTDLGKLGKYLGNDLSVFVSPRRGTQPPDPAVLKPEQLAEWFATRCDFVLTVTSGTQMTKLKDPARFPLVVEKAADEYAPFAVLFADGHVAEFAPHVPRAAVFRTQPSASRPASLVPLSPAQATTQAVVGRMPENLPAALAGSWRIAFAGTLEATYAFDPSGTFTLAFTASEGLMPQGKASGTWRLDGSRLVMTNTASNTPNTVVGEEEEGEIVGLDEQQLALRTTNRKGAEEMVVFQKVIPFAKGKRDNPHVVGTWQGDNLLLVVAESGLLVLNAAGQTMKGEWSQRGDQLLVLFDVPPPPQARNRNPLREMEPRTREIPLTIDLANETTLVLTGALLGRRDGSLTLLRVK